MAADDLELLHADLRAWALAAPTAPAAREGAEHWPYVELAVTAELHLKQMGNTKAESQAPGLGFQMELNPSEAWERVFRGPSALWRVNPGRPQITDGRSAPSLDAHPVQACAA